MRSAWGRAVGRMNAAERPGWGRVHYVPGLDGGG